MRFLRRSKTKNSERRCAICRERVPDGAKTCHMCGELLSPHRRGQAATRDLKLRET